MGEKNPLEYQQGTKRARQARKRVATQLGGLIESADLTGSHPLVARRIRAYAEALRSDDDFVVRASLMELAQAAGATVAAMDLAPRMAAQKAA